MQDDQATQNTDATNSTDQTQTNDQTDQSSDTSTTQNQADDEHIDLGAGGSDDDQQTDNQQQQTDTRTDEEKAADEERAKLFGAPEGDATYEVTGLPEGMDVDKAAVEALTPLAKKLNLSNEGFSSLAQVYAEKILPGVTQQVVDGINRQATDARQQWEKEARDAIAGKLELETVSGEKINFGGRSMGEVQKIAAKTLDKFAPAGFRKWLDETGLGVHPQMIALAYNVGKDIAEDRDAEPSDTNRKAPAGGGRPMTDPAKFYNH